MRFGILRNKQVALKSDLWNLSGLTPEDKRKLRREVLNTRGELLFARAVVLFEGETEEQAIPIFGEKYWDKDLYGVGSIVGFGAMEIMHHFLDFSMPSKSIGTYSLMVKGNQSPT